LSLENVAHNKKERTLKGDVEVIDTSASINLIIQGRSLSCKGEEGEILKYRREDSYFKSIYSYL
jgi:hypothetical protein